MLVWIPRSRFVVYQSLWRHETNRTFVLQLWDVYHEGNVLRTFMGHTKAVKDICFNNDGTKFLSAAYDRQIKLWDTETGES